MYHRHRLTQKHHNTTQQQHATTDNWQLTTNNTSINAIRNTTHAAHWTTHIPTSTSSMLYSPVLTMGSSCRSDVSQAQSPSWYLSSCSLSLDSSCICWWSVCEVAECDLAIHIGWTTTRIHSSVGWLVIMKLHKISYKGNRQHNNTIAHSTHHRYKHAQVQL